MTGSRWQPTAWEKILANHIASKRFEPRIYKELLQLNNKDKQPKFKTSIKEHNIVRRKLIECEKIFVNYIADKGLLSQILKNFYNSKPKSLFKNGQKTWTDICPK